LAEALATLFPPILLRLTVFVGPSQQRLEHLGLGHQLLGMKARGLQLSLQGVHLCTALPSLQMEALQLAVGDYRAADTASF
jgi:hypothetical protein